MPPVHCTELPLRQLDEHNSACQVRQRETRGGTGIKGQRQDKGYRDMRQGSFSNLGPKLDLEADRQDAHIWD